MNDGMTATTSNTISQGLKAAKAPTKKRMEIKS